MSLSNRLLTGLNKINRSFCWRLGRRIYMQARGDVPNVMATNGERRVQQAVLQHFASPGRKAVIFDVGANIGQWLLMLRAQCPDGGNQLELHAFEPFEATFQMLQQRLAQSWPNHHICLNALALSDQEGCAVISGADHSGISSLHLNPLHTPKQQLTVKTTTLDAYCAHQQIEHIALVKVDTEGHDFKVLRGAAQLLQDGRIGLLQFEYNHCWIYARHFLKDVFDYVHAWPYYIGKITPTVIEIYAQWHPELERFFEANYALIRHDVVDCFRTCQLRRDRHNAFVRIK